MQNDKISFDTFLKSENCLPDEPKPKEKVFKNTNHRGTDVSFIILVIIAAVSIALCIMYYNEAFVPIGDTHTFFLDDSSSSEAPQKIEGKININTADIKTLCTLKYIGEGKALRIVTHRMANGPFKDIADIKKVDGIGRATFEKIKDSICV